MKIRILIITALLAAMLMIGPASAGTPIHLTNTNNPELNGIDIVVIPDGANGNLSVQLLSKPVKNPAVGIDQFYYNLDKSDYSIDRVSGDPSGTWHTNFGGTTADGFGSFESHKSNNAGGTGGISSPIVFTLENPFSGIPDNGAPHNARIAVHIRFDKCSGWVSDGTTEGTIDRETTFGCTRPPTTVPEFPSIALPLAAILGLVIFFQYRMRKL